MLLNPNLNSGQIVDNNPVTTCISAHVKRGRDFDVRLLGVQTGGCTLGSLPAFFFAKRLGSGSVFAFRSSEGGEGQASGAVFFHAVLTYSCQFTENSTPLVTFPSFCR